mgnify:CR=1 FL=1
MENFSTNSLALVLASEKYDANDYIRDYDEFKGSICFLFLGEGLFRTLLYFCSGLLSRSVLWFSLISLDAALLSLAAARPLSRRIKTDTLQKLAIAFFLAGGVSIIVKSLLLRA